MYKLASEVKFDGPRPLTAVDFADSILDLVLRAEDRGEFLKGEGKYAVHFAVKAGLPYIVGALLDLGADPEIKDEEGKTAWDHIDAEAASENIMHQARVAHEIIKIKKSMIAAEKVKKE